MQTVTTIGLDIAKSVFQVHRVDAPGQMVIRRLRSSSGHDAFQEMVMAQGLGDEDRQAPRDEKSHRRAGASVGRDHASHLGRWHRIPMDQGGRRSVRTVRGQIRYEKT